MNGELENAKQVTLDYGGTVGWGNMYEIAKL
jgi:hypothetical protein